jgi:hypothetical protein
MLHMTVSCQSLNYKFYKVSILGSERTIFNVIFLCGVHYK